MATNAQDREFLHQRPDTWEEFEEIRRSDPFARTLQRLTQTVNLDDDIEAWNLYHPGEILHLHDEYGFSLLHNRYAEWARAMRQGDPDSFDLTLDRKAVREVLLNMWEFLAPMNNYQHVDEPLAIWMCKILCTVLPYERAESLFKMKYNSSEDFGMHWISKLPVHHVTDEHRRIHQLIVASDGKPTMNKRFVEIITFLQQYHVYESIAEPIQLINRLLKPTECRLEGLDEYLDVNNLQLPEGPEVVRLNASIRQATTIEDFCVIYKSTTFMQYFHVLRTLPGEQVLLDFASEWAERLDDVVFTPNDLQVILSLYRQLSECLMDQENHSVTQDSVRNRFKIQSISNGMGFALPLARALAIVNNQAWPEPWMENLCGQFENDLPGHLFQWFQ